MIRRGGLALGGVSATRSAVAAMWAAAAARCAGAIRPVTALAQPGWAAIREQASWMINACLARAAGAAPPSPSSASAVVSWAASRTGSPPIASAIPAGADLPGEGRNSGEDRDRGEAVPLCPALTRAELLCPALTRADGSACWLAAVQPAAEQTTTEPLAASSPSRERREASIAFNLTPILLTRWPPVRLVRKVRARQAGPADGGPACGWGRR